MEKREFDRDLERAALDAALERFDKAFADCNSETVPHSARYLRRMKTLCRDPFGYVKKQSRSFARRALRTVAVILLVLSLSCAGLSMVPPVRAAAERMFVTWFGDRTDYTFNGKETDVIKWYPAYIPAGFEETARYELFEHMSLVFRDEETSIWFTYVPAADGAQVSIDNTRSTYSEVIINETAAQLYTSNVPGYPNYLIWLSPEETTVFMLDSTVDTATLLRITEGVEPVE